MDAREVEGGAAFRFADVLLAVCEAAAEGLDTEVFRGGARVLPVSGGRHKGVEHAELLAADHKVPDAARDQEQGRLGEAVGTAEEVELRYRSSFFLDEYLGMVKAEYHDTVRSRWPPSN